MRSAHTYLGLPALQRQQRSLPLPESSMGHADYSPFVDGDADIHACIEAFREQVKIESKGAIVDWEMMPCS